MATPLFTGAGGLCMGGGACSGLAPSMILAMVRADAAAQPSSYGFTNDPNSPNGTRYYGYLLYTGGY
jgi:hypothetical protein